MTRYRYRLKAALPEHVQEAITSELLSIEEVRNLFDRHLADLERDWRDVIAPRWSVRA